MNLRNVTDTVVGDRDGLIVQYKHKTQPACDAPVLKMASYYESDPAISIGWLCEYQSDLPTEAYYDDLNTQTIGQRDVAINMEDHPTEAYYDDLDDLNTQTIEQHDVAISMEEEFDFRQLEKEGMKRYRYKTNGQSEVKDVTTLLNETLCRLDELMANIQGGLQREPLRQDTKHLKQTAV